MNNSLLNILICSFLFGAFLPITACRRVSENELARSNNKVEVMIRASNEEPSSSVGTREAQTKPLPPSTKEAAASGVQNNAEPKATDEAIGAYSISTSEAESSASNVAYVIGRGVLYQLQNSVFVQAKLLQPGEEVKVLDKVVVNIQGRDIPAVLIEDNSGTRGYFSKYDICLKRICLFEDREGVIETTNFGELTKRKVPQIRFIFFNLYPVPVKELRVIAQFFYKGEEIGEDAAYPVSVALGTKPLLPGEFSTVFLRPEYEMNPKDKLTPNNPIEIKVKCSVEYREHEDCGDFKIDQMFY